MENSLSSDCQKKELLSNGMAQYKLNYITCLYNNLIIGYDSDDEVFSSAPTSPCSEYSSSDESNMFYNAEVDFSYLLFSK